MRARADCAHPSIHDHWVLRYMRKFSDQVIRLKRDLQCLSLQESFVLTYRPTALEMKGRVEFVQTGNRTWTCGSAMRYHSTVGLSVFK
ncbi:hypothetical protein TNCV_1764891 [Trichonephila clavipes]|nr:hypothetical protein TNCV_1764891 [Trichonephila clavipes]